MCDCYSERFVAAGDKLAKRAEATQRIARERMRAPFRVADCVAGVLRRRLLLDRKYFGAKCA
jgi:hypothetical protein